ncbi:MAG: alpha/beta fold hydrolase [Planctomycetota bacterium]|nr:MAG: alpha/beta fold hydrolase [Planctomycetota bacterium]
MGDWKDLYPFESHFVELPKSETSVDSVRMHYVDQGDRSAEQTVLCVHGNPTWSFTFRRVLTDLADRARVVAPDHIGCGLSDKPQDYAYCLERHVGNLSRLIETLNLQNVTLLAHDWGGAIGVGAALKHPTRIGKLVLLNTGIFPPPFIPWRIRLCRLPGIGAHAIRRWNLFARAATTMALHRLPALPSAVKAGLLAPYDSWASRIGIASFVRDIPTRKSQPTWQVLESIEQGTSMLAHHPVTLVWGMKDWCFRPECLERMQRLFPQARVRRLDDVGHYVMEEAADEVLEEVRRMLDLPAIARGA